MKRALMVLLLLSQFSPGALAANITDGDVNALLATPVGGTVTIPGMPLDASRTLPILLKRIDVYAPDARVQVVENGVARDVPHSNWLSFVADKTVANSPYLGFAMAPDGSRVDGGIFGDDGRLYAVEGQRGADGITLNVWDATDHNRDGSEFVGTCANDLSPELRLPTKAEAEAAFANFPDAAKAVTGGSSSARVAIDSDVEFLNLRFANNTATADTWLTSLFTQLNVIYQRDLDVTLVVGDVFWRVGSDPYTSSGADIFDQLDEFGEVWFANNAAINRAFAAQMSGKLGSPGGFSGIAWLLPNRNYCTAKGQTFGGCPDGTCTFGHYSVNQTQTNTTSATAQDAKFIGHEIGHNFGANHTHCSDSTTGNGSPAVATNTMDTCFSGEAGSGCYAAATSCPASSTINGVTNVRGTIMSYCHLLGGCSSSAVFATAHVTYLTPFIALNVSNTCFTVGGAGTITIADRTLGEATTPMNFTLTRSSSTGTASVVATTVAGTATGGGTDYTNVTSQTVNFADGSLTATLNVTINNDAIDEDNETFVVNLTTPSAGYSITDAQATGTITDDDTTSISVNDPGAVVEGNPVNFTVTLSHANSRVVTVSRATADGTAAASGDYTSLSAATLTFNPGGPLTQQVAVTTNNDLLNEADSETFALNLSGVSATAVIGDAAGTGTINDNDATPTISIADATPEAENNVNPLRFVVTLSGPNQAPVSVTATTADDTATVADSDYQSRSAAVNFASGVVSQDFDVTKFGDTKFEANETFAVNLTNATAGINISDANATGTINNDDAGPVVSIADASRVEGNAGGANMAFTLSIPAAVGANATVNFSTSPIDATPGVDYTVTSGIGAILVGNTTATLNINVFGDMTDEWDEQFRVNITATASSTIGDGQAVGTITDDDAGELVYRNSFE